MKKIIAVALIFCMLLLCSCGSYSEVKTTYDIESEEAAPSMFVSVEDTLDWQIVYHKTTKVMYAVSQGGYNQGTFTLLVDENGDPLLWEGD